MNESFARYRASVLVAAVLACSSCVTALTPQVRNEISIQLASKQNELRACYQQALSRDENIAGTMTLSFVVLPDGQFTNVRVAEGDINDEELKQCVVQQASTLRLSQLSPTPVAVTYPLSLQPEPIP